MNKNPIIHDMVAVWDPFTNDRVTNDKTQQIVWPDMSMHQAHTHT